MTLIFHCVSFFLKKIGIWSLLLVGAEQAYAQQTTASTAPNLTYLKKNTTDIKSIKASAVTDWYEVQLNGEIVYLSQDGKTLLIGDMIDLEHRVNFTENSKNDVRRELIQSIADTDKIIYKAANEKYVVNVYTDYTCQYCQKFHQQITAANDLGITVKYLAFPRAGLNSEVAKNMQAAWCSADRNQALTDLKSNKTLPITSCLGSQVVDQFNVALKMGINATPTLILDNGLMSSGYRNPKDLLAFLESANKEPVKPVSPVSSAEK